MTLDEMFVLKNETSNKIQYAIDAFVKETGLQIKSIELSESEYPGGVRKIVYLIVEL